MRLFEQDLFTLHRPTKCFRRIDCEQRGVAHAGWSPFLLELQRMETYREEEHRHMLGEVLDLSQGTLEDRMQTTLRAIVERVPRIFRPLLTARAPFADEPELAGEPDFLILKQGDYLIREAGYAREADEVRNAELLRQLEGYGWLYEANFMRPPAGLQYVSFAGEVNYVPYPGPAGVLDELRQVYEVRASGLKMYEPVGEVRCRLCRFRERCFETALTEKDPAVLPAVDLSLARRLHQIGIRSYSELPAIFTAETLAAVKRPFGGRMRRVGSKAKKILDQVRAFEEQRPVVKAEPKLPKPEKCVLFDVLGLPEQVESTKRVYVWGLQLCGPGTEDYLPAVAGFGAKGDREGWHRFLDNAAAILEEHGNLDFVHWSRFEKDRLREYAARWGDHDGIADRVAANLLDLRLVVRDTVAIPDNSYGIFTVGQQAGFRRARSQRQSDEDLARFIRAVETRDEALQAETLDRAIERNREDLAANRAVLDWLRGLAVPAES